MKLYTATLIITKHLEWLDDKKHCPKVNEEKLKEAIELLTNLVKKLSLGVVVGRSEQLVCDKCGYPMFYHKPDDIMYCHGCDNTKPANNCPQLQLNLDF